MGAAVFRGDRMVGILNGQETAVLAMLRGNFRRAFVTVKDPNKENYFVSLDVRQARKPAVRLEIGRTPFVATYSLRMEAEVLSVQSGINYESPQLKPELEAALTTFIQEEATRLISRAQGEFKSDILRLGMHARPQVWTWRDWEALDWPRKFPDVDIRVEVRSTIRRTGLITRILVPG